MFCSRTVASSNGRRYPAPSRSNISGSTNGNAPVAVALSCAQRACKSDNWMSVVLVWFLLGSSSTGLREARGPGLGSSAGRRCGPQSTHKSPAPGCASVCGRALAARRAPAPAGLTRALRQRASFADGDVVTLPCRACQATRRRGAWGGAAGTGSARCSAAEMPSRAQSPARSCSAATRRASAAAAGGGALRASPSPLSTQNAGVRGTDPSADAHSAVSS
jgi:hypothetical protein